MINACLMPSFVRALWYVLTGGRGGRLQSLPGVERPAPAAKRWRHGASLGTQPSQLIPRKTRGPVRGAWGFAVNNMEASPVHLLVNNPKNEGHNHESTSTRWRMRRCSQAPARNAVDHSMRASHEPTTRHHLRSSRQGRQQPDRFSSFWVEVDLRVIVQFDPVIQTDPIAAAGTLQATHLR